MMKLEIPQVKLNTGATIPAIGLGTWQGSTDKERTEVKNAILEAIKAGYRHIDTAWLYQTEGIVGDAIRESGIPRNEFFVTTKLWQNFHTQAPKALEISLKNLGLDYIDLYLLHWPQSFAYRGEDQPNPKKEDGTFDLLPRETFIDTWKEMEKLLESSGGKIKAIGVSNFTIKTLEELLPRAKVVPAVNQVELHPYLASKALKRYCDEKGIVMTAYSPLGQYNSPLLKDETIVKIAKKHGVSAGQVLLAWNVQKGFTAVPKSGNPERLRQNINLSKLDDDDVREIDSLDRGHRLCPNPGTPEGMAFGWSFEELGWVDEETGKRHTSV